MGERGGEKDAGHGGDQAMTDIVQPILVLMIRVQCGHALTEAVDRRRR